MAKEDRNGKRVSREKMSNRKRPVLGYYLIVTDTEGTERLYFEGLKEEIKDKVMDKLIIKIIETKTRNLVKEAKNFLSELPQYAEPWIVFDRDKVPGFNKIIMNAKESDIGVAWSNPCIEIWFYAYFGKMPNIVNSWTCCREFSRELLRKTNQEYEKNDKNIYKLLLKYGDENKAIAIAKSKLTEHEKKGNNNPDEMIPSTTVHLLIEDIKNKIS